MDRVKKCWQGILKEREDFWNSFFIKYQEDKRDVDFRSYMDNSSTRVNTLLELAAEDDKEAETLKNTDIKVLRYFEEQSSESSTYSDEITTPLNEDKEKVENFKAVELPVVSEEKIAPTIVLEVYPKKKDSKCLLSRSATKKFISEDSKVSDLNVLQDFDELSSESTEAYNDEITTPLNEDQEEQKAENLKPVELPVVLTKKILPTFVLEVNPEEEVAKYLLSRNSCSAKKFKLFECPPHSKENAEDTITDDQYEKFSINLNSELLNESNASNVSEESGSLKKLICRRIKPTSKHVSNPKRFKLM